MKKNTQLWKAEDIADMIRVQDNLCLKNYYIKDNGDFVTKVWDDDSSSFAIERTFTAGDIAQKIDMPLWEVVLVDECGDDSYAVLYFED